ncbi:MAG: MetQ/NlpA family ABC transporter substrate-binding protein [Acetivibrionales bacterium]|jgi:D-methionine transport system substrate-binding protein|nr:ABC transporter substrate-binding protein [Clostridiaceae bacterium]
MKKIVKLALVLTLVLSIFSGCGASKKGSTIKVGASVTPHAEILNVAKEILAEKGITLEVVEFSDYVQPNTNVESGDLDANYFQHIQYLKQFNEDRGTHIVSVASIHYEPFGIFAGKTASLEELKDGAIISVPNDGTNEARALMLLEAQGLIKLKENADFSATILDIAENPKNLVIKEIEAAQLTLSLQDVDLAVINGNYAIQAGLNATTDALAIEDKDSDVIKNNYTNILCVKEGNEKNPAILELVNALKSEKVKTFIEGKYNGAVVPMF